MVFYGPAAICVQQSDTVTVLTAALTVFTLFVIMCVLAVLSKVLQNLLTTDQTEVIKAFRAFSSSFFFFIPPVKYIRFRAASGAGLQPTGRAEPIRRECKPSVRNLNKRKEYCVQCVLTKVMVDPALGSTSLASSAPPLVLSHGRIFRPTLVAPVVD